MFLSPGYLKYSDNPYKLIVDVENDISNYYRSFVPKYIRIKKPMYPAHISIVRKETPNLKYWKRYEGKKIIFQYDNFVFNDELYYWLNAYSEELEEIREELGLPSTSEITRSPDGRHKFHITIGNLKT